MILELTKKFLVAFDPDYTRLLPDEKKELDAILNDLEQGNNFVEVEM